MQREFIEGNRLIARFLGFKKHDYLWRPPFGNTMGYPKVIFEGDNTDSFKFHSSWDWLMPVVFKILFKTGFAKDGEEYIFAIQTALGNCEITNLFKTVVEFIEWHNQQLNKKIKTLRFYKEADDRWYVDLPEWIGEKSDLEMVLGADTLLDKLSDGKNSVTLNILEEETSEEGFEKLKKIMNTPITGGANYSSKYFPIWLCDVVRHVYDGRMPDVLYYKVAS